MRRLRIRKGSFFSVLLLFLIASLAMFCSDFLSPPVTESAQESKELWFDDFTSYNTRWNWAYNAGTGYKVLTTIDSYSVCEGGVRDESTSSEYSDCSLHHFRGVGDDEPIRVEIRMRYTDRNGLVVGDQGKGTKGCGWWDGTRWGSNVAWFMTFSPESDPSVEGFRCQVKREGIWYLNESISGVVDMMEWHVYRIDMLSSGTFFYVDNELVASTPYRPQSITQLEGGWVDNAYYYYSNGNPTRGYLDLDIDEKMYIDWVRLSIPPAADVTPPTTTHQYDGLWHDTYFTITLNATDDLSGVAETYYMINDGPIQNVTVHRQPLITTEGANNKLEYWSVDNAGNEELPHKVLLGIKLDKTAPSANAGADQTVNEDTVLTFDASASTDDNGIATYTWAFTDITPRTLSGQNPTYTFANPGTFTITLTVTDLAGNAATDTVIITVLDVTKPVANAGSDLTVDEDTPMTLDGSASSDNVAITAYTWTFMDLTTKTLTGEKPTYTFNTPDVYIITLNVTDAAGNWATDTVDIAVLDVTKPVANAGQDQTVNVGVTVAFDASGCTDNVGIVSYEWDFGDGTTGAGQTTTHLYGNPGTYTATLTVKDAAGNTAIHSVTITVLSAAVDLTKPVANAGSDQAVNEDTQMTLDGSASSDNVAIAAYTWTFTDVTTRILTGQKPTYTFNMPGVYTITLNVSDAAGNWAIDTVIITVSDVTKPVANAGQDQTANVGAPVYFDASSSTDNVGIVSYTWDFGDGSTGTGKTTSHTYTSAGTYTVVLAVEDASGNTATQSTMVTVSSAEGIPLWTIGVGITVIAIMAAAFLLRRRK